MLIEFRVENHRSIRDEQALTMRAGRVGAPDDPRPRAVPGDKTGVLPVAALYGANASGKSNLLAAFNFMRQVILLSHRFWSPDGGIPRAPFAWGSKSSEPSLFEVLILQEGTRYRYGFVADGERFQEEWLYAWPAGRKQTWFEREGDTFKFGEHLRGENRMVEQVTRPNALFLSAAAQHRHEQLTGIYRWFSAMRTVNVDQRQGALADLFLEHMLEQTFDGKSALTRPSPFGEVSAGDYLEAVRDLLRAADVGIVDIKLEDRDEDPGAILEQGRRSRVMVRHQSTANNAWLPFQEESHGTQMLYRMAPDLLHALQNGSLLLIDELEASLHPLLALQVVRQFNDPRANPRNAQLLFTTHDTNLIGTELGEPALRRDQIWLTEKDSEGATSLYPLTDYKPRKAENLERGYLQGRYGAIPFLGPLARVTE
ncbi:MAG TPA: ATP-binding protein [Haliangium sp.]|nr:ATP-binding protein [Haliangium sp.]